ncbi:MAG TPA: TonB-dependent receptor [Asticcacaulis sp.]|nr:TonB-dependent receptor [Asticcacaulis sp.]
MKFTLIHTVAAAALLAAGGAYAQAAIPAAASDTTEVVVYGHGQSRQTETVKAQDITLSAPGTSPLKVINKLPGVNFQSADPFGAYEWSTYMTIRGFSQNQMGFTLDGVTLGDMSYGNYNGLHISRAIINEDVARTELAQGAGALETASSSNLGGALVFTSRDPSHDMGGELSGTLGQDSMHRLYGRFETGAIDALGGLRGYISLVDQKTDKWKGYGEQRAKQADTKWVLPTGDTGEITAFVNHSERREQDYQDLSLSMTDRLGRKFDNFQPDWALANQVAKAYQTSVIASALSGTSVAPVYPAPIETVDDAYYYGAGVRNDTLSAISTEQHLGDVVTFTGEIYHHDNKGQGLWTTPYLPSPGNADMAAFAPALYNPASTDDAYISIRTTEYKINRTGMTFGLKFDLGAHQVSAGGWYEDNNFNQARRFYGESLAATHRDSLGFQSDPFYTQWEYAFNTKTTNLYLQDVWSLTPAFKLNYGFKSLEVINRVHTVVGNSMEARLSSRDKFLPQLGAVYTLNRGNELFASYSENMDAYVSAATAGPFAAQSQSVVDYIKDHLKPESSKTIEGGWRFRMDRLQGVAALYHVDFKNRILAIQQGPAILGNTPVLSNVGSVQTNGLELAATYRMTPEWKLYAAYSYNDSKYKDDVVDATGAVLANTKNKTVVNSPKNMVKTELSYDNGGLFATLSANYLGPRYYTYTNVGGRVKASTVADLSAGYHFSQAKLDLQLNVTNLLDANYIGTIGEAGFVNSDPNNTAQTVMVGAPRRVFVTVRKSF